MADGINRARSQLSRLRKERRQGGVPAGYAGPGGAARAQQGDDEAPFEKVPPFPTKAQVIWAAPTLINAYGLSDDFDVESSRKATLLVRYTPGENNSKLSIIPLVFEVGEELGIAMQLGVVDATLTALTPPTLSGPWGSRLIYPSEFRTAALPAAVPFQFVLQWDVEPYARMAFLAAEVGAEDEPGELELKINTSE